MSDTLTESISKGVEELGAMPEFGGPEPDGKSDKTPKSEGEAENENINLEDPTIEETTELTAEETTNAKNLFKMLNDPKTSAATIEFLAKQAGLDIGAKPPETKEEVKQQTKDIIAEMKEAAPGLDFLIDKIGPIIKQHLEDARQEALSEIEVDRTERANEVLKDESSKALITIGAKFKYPNNMVPDNVIKTMSTMMDKITPSPDLKPIDYISMIHDAARAKLGIGAPEVRRTANPAARLASDRVSPTARPQTPTKMNINQAIAAAVEELSGGKS